MPRFLLALFLLAALSACGSDRENSGQDVPPEPTEALDSAINTGWNLPWYYLGGPSCLAGGTAAPQTVLIDSLLELSEDDPEEFRNVILDTSPQVSLIDRIRDIVNATAQTYTWTEDWPDDLAVRVRRMPSSSDIVLQREILLRPDMLVLPWPFPNDTEGELAARAQALGITIPDAPELGAHGFYIDRILAVADTIVTKDQDAIPDPANEGQARDTIIARVRMHPAYTGSAAPFPAAIRVDTARATDETEVRYVTTTTPGGQLELVLGWQNEKGIDFVDWPCDALQ